MGFEEDRILHPRPVFCPALPAIHKKLLNNCTALLCLGFPHMLNKGDTEVVLGPGIFLEGPDKKHWKCCLGLCPLPLKLGQAQRGEKLLGS